MKLVLALASLTALVVCALLGARPEGTTTRLTLRLTDGTTGKPVSGIARIFVDGEKAPRKLEGLFDRLRGLTPGESQRGWQVVPAEGATLELPRAKIQIEALSGLETKLTRQEVDLTARMPEKWDVPLTYLYRPAELGLTAGNTHLHLRGLTRAEADDYLRLIPAVDGIAIQFVSYLERVTADAAYVTNEYPTGEITEAVKARGFVINNGEEYRHNFGAGGQGYGHVMFLNMKERILPASLGPGITGKGSDDTPLRGGIEAARKQGATVLWCHNTFGVEGVPSVLAGRVDALNVFDGSRTGTFEDKYYRYLNVGLRLPISTGTDWFQYDFSRVYVRGREATSVAGWLEGLKAGRDVITNGPLLSLKVEGQEPGAVLNLEKPRSLKIEIAAVGRHDFEAVELICNGKVIAREAAKARDGAFHADATQEAPVDAPAWFALRVLSRTRNELGEAIFAHTSPVYVDFAGRRVFEAEDSLALLKLVETGREEIVAKGRFTDPAGRKGVLAIHDEAIEMLKRRGSR